MQDTGVYIELYEDPFLRRSSWGRDFRWKRIKKEKMGSYSFRKCAREGM